MKLNFLINGEFLTNLFRDKLWEEKNGLDNVIDSIKKDLFKDSNLSEEEKENLCLDLLTGKKKIVNDGDLLALEEDNENNKSLRDYIRLKEKENFILELKCDILSNPIKYFDRYATIISTNTDAFEDIENYEELRDIFYYTLINQECEAYSMLDYGFNVIFNDDFYSKELATVISKIPKDNEEFCQNLYCYYEKRIKESSKNSLFIKDLIKRNRKHKADNTDGIDIENLKDASLLNPNCLMQQDFDLTPIPIDNIEKGWEGFVDPLGNFYITRPIGVSMYKGSAFCHSDFCEQYCKEKDIIVDDKRFAAEDYLVEKKHWIAYGHSSIGSRSAYARVTHKPTTEQKETLFKLWELNKDNLSTYYSQVEGISTDI